MSASGGGDIEQGKGNNFANLLDDDGLVDNAAAGAPTGAGTTTAGGAGPSAGPSVVGKTSSPSGLVPTANITSQFQIVTQRQSNNP